MELTFNSVYVVDDVAVMVVVVALFPKVFDGARLFQKPCFVVVSLGGGGYGCLVPVLGDTNGRRCQPKTTNTVVCYSVLKLVVKAMLHT